MSVGPPLSPPGAPGLLGLGPGPASATASAGGAAATKALVPRDPVYLSPTSATRSMAAAAERRAAATSASTTTASTSAPMTGERNGASGGLAWSIPLSVGKVPASSASPTVAGSPTKDARGNGHEMPAPTTTGAPATRLLLPPHTAPPPPLQVPKQPHVPASRLASTATTTTTTSAAATTTASTAPTAKVSDVERLSKENFDLKLRLYHLLELQQQQGARTPVPLTPHVFGGSANHHPAHGHGHGHEEEDSYADVEALEDELRRKFEARYAAEAREKDALLAQATELVASLRQQLSETVSASASSRQAPADGERALRDDLARERQRNAQLEAEVAALRAASSSRDAAAVASEGDAAARRRRLEDWDRFALRLCGSTELEACARFVNEMESSLVRWKTTCEQQERRLREAPPAGNAAAAQSALQRVAEAEDLLRVAFERLHDVEVRVAPRSLSAPPRPQASHHQPVSGGQARAAAYTARPRVIAATPPSQAPPTTTRSTRAPSSLAATSASASAPASDALADMRALAHELQAAAAEFQ